MLGILTALFTLEGLTVGAYAVGKGVKSVVKGVLAGDPKQIHIDSPFLDIDVPAVSEGDRVVYAYERNGRFEAHIKNDRKHAKLDLEADSKEELAQMISDTFRAWAITGHKRI